MAKIETTRDERMALVNQVIVAIASQGRKFFAHEGRISHFMSKPGSWIIYFVDGYSQKSINTSAPGRWRGFTQGGTLLGLVKDLAQFIRTGTGFPSMSFGPWPDYICGGDLWGYGPEAMEELRSAVHAIFPNDYVVPVTPTPTSDSVDEEANVGVPGISTEEKSYRITVYDEDGDASYHLDCFSLEEKDVKLAKVLNLPWVARVDVEEVVTTRTILHKLHKEITEWRDGDPTPLTLDDIERGHVRYTHTEYRHVVNCKSSPGWWKTLSIGRAREYALNPKAVTGLYCDRCGNTCPAAEFQWPDGTVVGT